MTDKLKKILQLAEKGIGGEKANAQKLLDRLLKKSGLTIEDLKDQEKKSLHYFRYKSWYEERLINQILMTVADDRKLPLYVNRRMRKVIGAYLTNAQKIEVDLLFDSYKKALEGEMRLLYRAFLHVNKIFPLSDELEDRELTDEEAWQLKKMVAMMRTMDKVQVRKALSL